MPKPIPLAFRAPTESEMAQINEAAKLLRKASRRNARMPAAVLLALAHVRQFHPDVTMVLFTASSQWIYITQHHGVPAFGNDISVSLLEDAQSAAAEHRRFPHVYELEFKETDDI